MKDILDDLKKAVFMRYVEITESPFDNDKKEEFKKAYEHLMKNNQEALLSVMLEVIKEETTSYIGLPEETFKRIEALNYKLAMAIVELDGIFTETRAIASICPNNSNVEQEDESQDENIEMLNEVIANLRKENENLKATMESLMEAFKECNR